ncbi:MAG: DUF1992 domain-containing protein [Anaeromyxobacter sp.]
MKGKRAQESHEGFVDRLIREAREEGAFDHLPGEGKPLPLTGDLPEAWWIKEKLRRERVNDLPEALSIRHDAEALAAALGREGDEQVVRQKLEEMNRRIRRLNATAVAGPPTTLAPFDVEGFVARWRAGRSRGA